LSNAFDELAAFIVQVEPTEEFGDDSSSSEKKKRRKSIDGTEDASGITRLDLIQKSLRLMKRLHNENAHLKRAMAGYEAHGGQHPSNDNVRYRIIACHRL
jgi:hypothetical protein